MLNRIYDAAAIVDSGNMFKRRGITSLHCNVDGTYFIYNGSSWIKYEMLAGLDYYDLDPKGISLSNDGATPIPSGNITALYL